MPLNGPLVRRIQDAGVPVYSEIEVAYRLCKAPIVAVTGTKGKSTTTSLIGHLFRECGKAVHVGGNIGNPLIREVLDAKPSDWVVAEVSSFQLESIRAFRPRVSVILNISADHLDRYYSMDEYAEAKFRIFANQNEQDFFVGNLDDERVAALHWQSGEGRVHARQLWFTLEEHHERATMYLRGDTVMYAPISGDPRAIEILDLRDIPLAGRHNVQNVMAALLAVLAAGVDPQLAARRGEIVYGHGAPAAANRRNWRRAVRRRFEGDQSRLRHRGTAGVFASIVLIAGGKSKNTDFTELGRVIDERAEALVVIGEAASDIAAHVYRTPIERADSMEDAVRRARALASSGGIVLLSPACASFDMFQSAEDRGQRFIAAVRAMPEFAGR